PLALGLGPDERLLPRPSLGGRPRCLATEGLQDPARNLGLRRRTGHQRSPVSFRRATRRRQQLPFRFASYLLINDTALLLSGPLLFVLVSALGMDVLLANLLLLVLLVLGRFAIADSYIWGSKSVRRMRLAVSMAKE